MQEAPTFLQHLSDLSRIVFGNKRMGNNQKQGEIMRHKEEIGLASGAFFINGPGVPHLENSTHFLGSERL